MLKCFVVGFTGEIGKRIVEEATKCDKISKLTLIGRRTIDLSHDKVIQHVVNFDELEKFSDCFADHDVGFCCLGTTRSKSGPAGFKPVDYDYVLKTATIAKQMGCKHFHLVTSGLANPKSRFAYLRLKGQVEQEVFKLGFERASVYRPGMLMCNRQERQLGERIAHVVFTPIAAIVPTWITMPTEVCARAMLGNCFKPATSATEIFENSEIHALARQSTV